MEKTEAKFVFGYGMVLSAISYIVMVLLDKGIMIWMMFLIFFFGLALMIFSLDSIRDLSEVKEKGEKNGESKKSKEDL